MFLHLLELLLVQVLDVQRFASLAQDLLLLLSLSLPLTAAFFCLWGSEIKHGSDLQPSHFNYLSFPL